MKKKIIATFLVVGLLGFPILAPAQDLSGPTRAVIDVFMNQCGMQRTELKQLRNSVRAWFKGPNILGVVEVDDSHDSKGSLIKAGVGFFPGETNMDIVHRAQYVIYLTLQAEMGNPIPKSDRDIDKFVRRMRHFERIVRSELQTSKETHFEFDDLLVSAARTSDNAVLIVFERY